MLSRSVDTKFAFDLDLLKEQNDRNPVYYVQYGHARICSIERRVAEKGQSVALDMPLIYDHPAELGLIRKILELPEIVELVVNTLQPHHYTTYAREIAQAFSIFYENCRILDTTPDIAGRRLKLAQVARLTLARVLDIMGMSAPEKM
jgi:arginyl-tRNA synthetase